MTVTHTAKSSDVATDRRTGTHTNVDTTEATDISISVRKREILIKSLIYRVTGGTALTYAPALRESAAGDNKLVFASTVVGTDTDHLFDPPVRMETDSGGSIFLLPQFVSDVDNDGTWAIEFDFVG